MTAKLLIASLAATLFSHATFAKGAGDSDIFVGDLVQQSGAFTVSNITNITDRDGYDNQPHFSADGSLLLFTAQHKLDDKQNQTDSFSYHLASNKLANLTNSKLSEYSPTLTTAQDKFTVVQVEADNRQRLWQFSMNSAGPAELLLPHVEPVGYFAFGPKNDLAMFVLGEPHTLQYMQNLHSKPAVIDDNIGRSVKLIPGSQQFSYIKLNQGSKLGHWAMTFDPQHKTTKQLIQLPPGSEYFNWHPQQVLFTADGNQLMSWDKRQQKAYWQPVQHNKDCDGVITRIAISNQGDKIAFVCQW